MINISFIFYKFSFEKNFTKLFIDKDFITLNELKAKLFDKVFNTRNNVSFNRKIDFDYEIKNFNSSKIITNPNELILKNTYLDIKRIVNLESSDQPMQTLYKSNLVQTLKDEESKLLNTILNESMNQMLVCKLCKKSGHLNKNCPFKGTALKPPSGIPKSNWIEIGPEKKIMTHIEYIASLSNKKEDNLFLEESLPQKPIETKLNYPTEFKCPFGDHLIKDAVLIPCCGKFFSCDSCILNKISQNIQFECPNKECSKEMDSFQFIKSSDYLNSKITNYMNSLKEKSESKPLRVVEKENMLLPNIKVNNQTKKVRHEYKQINDNQLLINKFLGIKKRKSSAFNENFTKKQKL